MSLRGPKTTALVGNCDRRAGAARIQPSAARCRSSESSCSGLGSAACAAGTRLIAGFSVGEHAGDNESDGEDFNGLGDLGQRDDDRGGGEKCEEEVARASRSIAIWSNT